MLVNSRVISNETLINEINGSRKNSLLLDGETIVALIIDENIFSSLKNKSTISTSDVSALGLIEKEIEANIIVYPWDIIYKNKEEIVKDIERMQITKSYKVFEGVQLIQKQTIHISDKCIGTNCKVMSGSVLDGEGGPIFIDEGVVIMPNTVIFGPAYIGKNTIIKAGSKIYGGTSIGPWCKVGGEIEESVFQGYSNKQHDGFIGHSYIGEWVNLGANTNNSDLKNNYANVEMYNNGQYIDTGKMFCGSIIADHAKTGISTMLNTGTVIGVSANVFGAGYQPKHIPSFSWGGNGKFMAYDIEKAVATAKIAMSRRSIEMTAEYEMLFRKIFELTASLRNT